MREPYPCQVLFLPAHPRLVSGIADVPSRTFLRRETVDLTLTQEEPVAADDAPDVGDEQVGTPPDPVVRAASLQAADPPPRTPWRCERIR